MARSRSCATGHHHEHELLLLCARTSLDSQGEAQIAQLRQHDLDWDYLLSWAHQHRVLPLLYRRLSRSGLHSLPEPAASRLRSAFQANARRNLLLTSELLCLMDALSAHGIPSIPYKGPVLASTVYGDLSLRQFADLDLIVPAADVVNARALLMARGYRPETQTTDEQLRASTGTEKDITLLHDDRGINLEIHWGITTNRDPIWIRPGWLWTNLETCSIAGRSIQTLTREDLLLVLCVHGAKHRWERLAWLCDVAELVRSEPTLDWNRAVETAVHMGGGRILLLGLLLARELLGAEPPPHVLKAIQADRMVTVLATQVTDWLFSAEPVALDLGEREHFFLQLRERPADRLRVAMRQARPYLVPTTRDQETISMPDALRWSLYFLRPVRLAGQYGLTPIKRFCKGLFQS